MSPTSSLLNSNCGKTVPNHSAASGKDAVVVSASASIENLLFFLVLASIFLVLLPEVFLPFTTALAFDLSALSFKAFLTLAFLGSFPAGELLKSFDFFSADVLSPSLFNNSILVSAILSLFLEDFLDDIVYSALCPS